MGFLIAAVVISAFVTYGVVWYYRRPKSMETSIQEFSRGLDALAPRDPEEASRGPRRRERR